MTVARTAGSDAAADADRGAGVGPEPPAPRRMWPAAVLATSLVVLIAVLTVVVLRVGQASDPDLASGPGEAADGDQRSSAAATASEPTDVDDVTVDEAPQEPPAPVEPAADPPEAEQAPDEPDLPEDIEVGSDVEQPAEPPATDATEPQQRATAEQLVAPVSSYLDALGRRDFASAHVMLAPELAARPGWSLEAITDFWDGLLEGIELRDLAEADVDRQRVTVQLDFLLAGGERSREVVIFTLRGTDDGRFLISDYEVVSATRMR